MPSPPIAGLHDMAPTVENRWVTSAVLAPIRADALAASQPAWPPPITITSNGWAIMPDYYRGGLQVGSGKFGDRSEAVTQGCGSGGGELGPVTKLVRRLAVFHVKQPPTLRCRVTAAIVPVGGQQGSLFFAIAEIEACERRFLSPAHLPFVGRVARSAGWGTAAHRINEMTWMAETSPSVTGSTVSAGVVSPSLGRHVPRYPPGSNVFEGPQISLKKRRDEHVFTRHHQGVRVPAPGTTVIGFGMTGFSWPSTYSWFRLNTPGTSATHLTSRWTDKTEAAGSWRRPPFHLKI